MYIFQDNKSPIILTMLILLAVKTSDAGTGGRGGGLATALSPSIFGRLVSPISISFILLTTYLQPHFFYLPASLKTNLILLTLLYETLCTIVLSISNGKSWLYWALKILSNWNSCNSQRVDKNYPNFQSCSKGTTFLLNVYLSPIDKKIDIFRLIFFFLYNFAKCTIQAQYVFFSFLVQ
jgi:hypothetical protein